MNAAINIVELVDIRSIEIDTSRPVAEKQASYYAQIGNHRCFRYDDTIVRVSFLDKGPSFQERMKQYLLSGQSAELTLP